MVNVNTKQILFGREKKTGFYLLEFTASASVQNTRTSMDYRQL